jgi:LacI family transcriptional regulator
LSEHIQDRSHHKQSGIKEIAAALGVSIGTVDRALHDRPGINSLTRARVLKMAQTLGYRPNFAARHLKLRRKLQISVNLPREIASFFDALREGISEAARPFESTIELKFRSFPHLAEGDVEAFSEALKDSANGIIVAPGHPADIKPWIRRAARAHVPVVCVATDAPGTERLTSISTDPYTSGAMVAEWLSHARSESTQVLLVTGDLSTVDHAEKKRGFEEFIRASAPHLNVARVLENHDQQTLAYELAKTALADTSIRAVYVCTANSLPIIRALEEAGRLETTSIVTTDLFPGLVPYLRSGKVMATVYQRPITQGRMAFQALYQFLVGGTCPPLRHRLPAHMVLRSNLDLFLEMLPGDVSDTDTAPPTLSRGLLHRRGTTNA